MANFLTNRTCTFQAPDNKIPTTYTNYSMPFDCTLSQASYKDMTWARFSGIQYQQKLLVYLPQEARLTINEVYRVVVDGKTYKIDYIKPIITNFDYSHTAFYITEI